MGVATAIAIGGLAMTAASTANSFAQASAQKSKQRSAEAAASKAMSEAKNKLGVNYANELSIQKEPYELQREAFLSQGAQAIQAGQESERGAEATAGKVMMAQNEAQAGIRTAMGAEMTDIQKQKIAEQSRLRDLGVQLDLGEAEGAQNAARSAEEASTAATAQGIQGVMSTAQQGLGMITLFPKSGTAPAAATPSGPAPTNPLPGNAQSYGPGGTNYAPMSSYNTQSNSFGPQTPKPGTQYGAFGTNWSGLGG